MIHHHRKCRHIGSPSVSQLVIVVVSLSTSFPVNCLLITYFRPSLPVEYRPSTTPRHRTLFWAALVILDQLVPCCFSSASVSRLHLLRGRPLFLFPCGFQVRAWRVVLDAGFLRVCPIQPHFLRSICLATGSCPARSHRPSHWPSSKGVCLKSGRPGFNSRLHGGSFSRLSHTSDHHARRLAL